MYTMQDLKSLTLQDLRAERTTAMSELYAHGLRVKLGQEQTHDKLTKLRGYIAQISTVETQKKKEEAQKEKPAAK